MKKMPKPRLPFAGRSERAAGGPPSTAASFHSSIRSRSTCNFSGCSIDHGHESQRECQWAGSSGCRLDDRRRNESSGPRGIWQQGRSDHRRLSAGLSQSNSIWPLRLHRYFSMRIPAFAQAARKAAWARRRHTRTSIHGGLLLWMIAPAHSMPRDLVCLR